MFIKKIITSILFLSIGSLSLAQGMKIEEVDEMFERAEQGDPQAQANLGGMYEEGIGIIQQDYVEAVKWYEKAANQGHVGAQYYLGILYEEGKGVSKNINKAKELYGEACKNAGGGVSCDDYQRVKNQNINSSGNIFIQILNDLESDIDLKFHYDIDENEFTRSERKTVNDAEQGDVESMFKAAYVYGSHSDVKKMFYWLKQASLNGNVTAIEDLAERYDEGEDLKVNYTKSKELYRKVCEIERNLFDFMDHDSCDKYQELKDEGY